MCGSGCIMMVVVDIFSVMHKVLFWTTVIGTAFASFHVEKSGILPVAKKDVYIEFYLLVANDGAKDCVVKVISKPKCCWEVVKGDQDCESMVLYGKDSIRISPSKVTNMTYLFPNKYPLNRLGHCNFHLESGGVNRKQKIRFDTREVLKDSWIPGFGYSGKVKTCPSVDKDPYKNCAPVDCTQKYNGKRNFYNARKERCEKAAWCNTKRDNENLPISAFDKDNNRCKSLVVGSLKQSEKKKMKKESDETVKLSGMGSLYEAVSNPSKIELNCNRGTQEGSFCFCNTGWVSATKKDKSGKKVIEWCNKKVSPEGKLLFGYYVGVMTISGLFHIGLLLLLLYLTWIFFLKKEKIPLKSMDSLIGESDESSYDFD